MEYEDAIEAQVSRAQACGELRRHRVEFGIRGTSIIIKDEWSVNGEWFTGEHEIKADANGLYNGKEILDFLGY